MMISCAVHAIYTQEPETKNKGHIDTSGHKAHQCGDCGQSFSALSKLKAHQRKKRGRRSGKKKPKAEKEENLGKHKVRRLRQCWGLLQCNIIGCTECSRVYQRDVQAAENIRASFMAHLYPNSETHTFHKHFDRKVKRADILEATGMTAQYKKHYVAPDMEKDPAGATRLLERSEFPPDACNGCSQRSYQTYIRRGE